MSLALPFSKNKNYLSGMDWMMQAIDYASREKLNSGNDFQIVMDLKGSLNDVTLQFHLNQYLKSFPLLSGKLARDFNLAPYIKVSTRDHPVNLALTLYKAENYGEAQELLKQELNLSKEKETFPLRVVLVKYENNTLLGFLFDHRFFDARGAELFLQGLNKSYSDKDQKHSVDLTRLSPAYLNDWAKQFKAGKKLNRLIREKFTDLNVLGFHQDESVVQPKNVFFIKCFTESETKAIRLRAESKSGPFLFLLYSLALTIKTLSPFLMCGNSEGDVVVPVTRDMRHAKEIKSTILFNYLSFLFFHVKIKEAHNIDALIESLMQQFYQQIKEERSEDLWHASMLMRIVPRTWMADKLKQSKTKKNRFSFSFASLGKSLYENSAFMNCEIQNIYHVPRVPVIPAVGIYFSEFNDRLNVVLSIIEGSLTAQEAEFIFKDLCAEL